MSAPASTAGASVARPKTRKKLLEQAKKEALQDAQKKLEKEKKMLDEKFSQNIKLLEKLEEKYTNMTAQFDRISKENEENSKVALESSALKSKNTSLTQAVESSELKVSKIQSINSQYQIDNDQLTEKIQVLMNENREKDLKISELIHTIAQEKNRTPNLYEQAD